MIVTITKKAETKEFGTDDIVGIWSTQDSGIDSDPLNASILESDGPGIEVSKQYKLDEFRKLLENWELSYDEDPWVELHMDSYKDDDLQQFMWVSQPYAAKIFLTSILDSVQSLTNDLKEVWVSVE